MNMTSFTRLSSYSGQHGSSEQLPENRPTEQSENLEVDLNFMFRQPLWEIYHAYSHPLGDYQAKDVPLLDFHEFVAGKLSALFSRKQARALFDCHRILDTDTLQSEQLRIAFVVCRAMNRKDWRTISIDDVEYDELEMAEQLGPTLRARQLGEQASPAEHGAQLLKETRRSLSALIPFTDAEQTFLDLPLDKGEFDAMILASDTSLQKHIQVQRLLEWKAFNVRSHKGLS